MDTKVIYKYRLNIEKSAWVVPLPKNAQVLHVAFQGDVPFLWALVDARKGATLENRAFGIAGTGELIGDNEVRFINTFFHTSGDVYHAFEIPQHQYDGRIQVSNTTIDDDEEEDDSDDTLLGREGYKRTVRALSIIAQAMENPNTRIPIRSRLPETLKDNEDLTELVEEIANDLGIDFKYEDVISTTRKHPKFSTVRYIGDLE